MNNHTIFIQTLSPLHIGNGNTLTSVGEYVSTSQTVRIVDQERLLPLLKSKGIYEDYINYILNYAEHTHVWDFFTTHGMEKEIAYIREMPLNARLFNPESNNILELAIETGGQKYIPGSSLKGAIRTILFANCIASDHDLKSEIEKIVKHDKLNDIRKLIEKIEDEVLKKTCQHVWVEDSKPVGNDKMVVEIAKRVHLFGVQTDGLDNLRECIGVDVAIKTTLSMEESRLDDDFGFLKQNDLTGLFQVINRVTETYIDHEIKLLKSSSEPLAREIIQSLTSFKAQIAASKDQSAIMRLGKGKTYIYQVILPFLSIPSQQKIIELMVGNEEKRINFPRTRVLTDHNSMFGWVKISMPEFSVEDITFFNNVVENPEKGVTKIKAYFLEMKKVCFMHNGLVYREVQLVNHMQRPYRKGEEIEVTVQQITKEGKINQVKID
jgi:CRISPR type III-A-associated RAMP protein Csm5